MTKELMIVKGFQSTTPLGDPSAQADLQATWIDLYGGDFTIKDDGGGTWVPQIATLKNNGIRVDSGLLDGSNLVGAAMGNVIETIPLYAGASHTAQARLLVIKKLLQFAQAARDFHTTEWQIYPVYLHWFAKGAPGAQYALIYNIDVSISRYDPTNLLDVQELVITVEREPAWRGVPPGGNPKLWTFYTRGMKPTQATPVGLEYNYDDLDLNAGAGNYTSLVEGNVRIHDEEATSQINYVDIPAASIPGDAEALCEIASTTPNIVGVNWNRLYISRSTRRDLYPTTNAQVILRRKRNTLNPFMTTSFRSLVNLTTTLLAQADGILRQSDATRYVFNLAYAAGAVAGSWVAYWDLPTNQYQGRYALYMRAYVNAFLPQNIKFTATAYNNSTVLGLFSDSIVVPMTASYTVYYLGEINLTPDRMVGINGRGLDTNSLSSIFLSTEKINDGSTANITIWDLILMPVDEPNQSIEKPTAVDFGTNSTLISDTTGYLSGGKIKPLAASSDASFTNSLTEVPLIGDGITLVPNADNRLYFLTQYSTPQPTADMRVRVNIVPRWYGVRDS